MPDFIPASDAEFDGWLQNFVDNVVANATSLGASPADVTALQGMRTDWDAKYPASNTAFAASLAATQAKTDSRIATEAFIRPFVGRVQSSPTVKDSQRHSLGI